MANGNAPTDHLQKLKAGKADWNEYREKRRADILTLEDVDLSEENYLDFDLTRIVFRRCDFSQASFSGAHLEGTKFEKCCLRNAIFSKQLLSGKKGSKATDNGDSSPEKVPAATGLSTCGWSGSDLGGARFPKDFLFPGINKVKDLTVLARGVWYIFLIASAFCMLSLDFTDLQLVTNVGVTRLPIVLADVQIKRFFIFTPVLLAIIFIVFQMHLADWWREVSELPSIFPSGSRPNREIQPWLFSRLARFTCASEIPEDDKFSEFILGAIRDYFCLAMGHLLGPFVLWYFWYKYMPRHGMHTVLHLFLLWFALMLSWYGFSKAHARWQPQLVYRRVYGLMRRCHIFPKCLADRFFLWPTLIVAFFGVVSLWVCYGPTRIGFQYWHFYLNLEHRDFSSGKPGTDARRSPNHKDAFQFSVQSIEPQDSLVHQESKEKPTVESDSVSNPNGREIRWKNRNFHFAKLNKTQFNDDDLSGSIFCDAELKEADFSGAFLQGSNFFRADLREAIFSDHADLMGANLNHVDLRKAVMKDITLTGAKLHHAKMEGITFENVVMGGAEFLDAEMHGFAPADNIFDGGEFSRAILSEAKLQGKSFVGALLDGCDLSGAQLQNANLKEAHLEGATLRGTLLIGAFLKDAHLSKADFLRARLEDADLCGADLTGARNLTLEQLRNAHICKATKLPADLEQYRDLIPSGQ